MIRKDIRKKVMTKSYLKKWKPEILDTGYVPDDTIVTLGLATIFFKNI